MIVTVWIFDLDYYKFLPFSFSVFSLGLVSIETEDISNTQDSV